MKTGKHKAASQSVPIHRYRHGQVETVRDEVATESPLEIRIAHGPISQRSKVTVSITMRTPGHDEELALGFLFSEGLLKNAAAVMGPPLISGEESGVITFSIHPDVKLDVDKLHRNFYTTSSCGVCGKASVEALFAECPVYSYAPPLRLSPALITSLPDRLREAQDIFQHTGGLHACALFDAQGLLYQLREDVGRHNAMDKLIGAALLEAKEQPLALADKILLLSGRASFELLQKAAMAGLRYVCAVGAPSSLAVETAEKFGITLIGFLREGRFNVYTGDAIDSL